MTPVTAEPILDLIQAFRRSKTMFTAVSLGVFDRLAAAPARAAALASALQCDVDSLTRLLDACVGLDLLTRTDDGYSNTEMSARYLVASSADTLAPYIVYSDRSLYRLWSHLEDAVREGTNRWEQAFGSRTALFEHFFRDQDSQRSFLGGMHGFGRLSSPVLVRKFDLSPFRSLVDLGGATGHLCLAACEAYPGLTATIFDLPPVQRFAEEHIAASAVGERVKFVAGDFFKDPLPPGDLYSLGRILHDWSEEKVRILLKKIFDALPSQGALLIGETLLEDNRCGPLPSLMQDLSMLVATEGRERTCSDYRALLHEAGFRSVQCRRTGAPLDAVLSRKP
jgi:acetylserotonin N-methyltransferase